MSIAPILVSEIPPLTRPEALEAAASEYARYLELLRVLPSMAWDARTECVPWTVRDMASHVLGATESIASVRELVHQLRAAHRRDLNRTDALAALQIDERARLTPDEIVGRLQTAAGASVRARRRIPGLARRIRFTADLPYGRERWTLGFLHDVIYTRDTWMHRSDTARTVGAVSVLTPEHDGRLVANIVADWARRHGEPFDLILTGPAGGHYRVGNGDGERIELDAVELSRRLSGRGASWEGLFGTPVPF